MFITEGLLFSIYLLIWYIFKYGINVAIDKYPSLKPENFVGLFNTNIDTELHWYEKETDLCRLNESDGISTLKLVRKDVKIVYTFDERFPICRRKYAQSVGEDLLFKCLWNIQNVNNIEYIAKWTLNGSEIENKNKITMTCNMTGFYKAKVLRVSPIDKTHFGEYQLWFAQRVQTKPSAKPYDERVYDRANVFTSTR